MKRTKLLKSIFMALLLSASVFSASAHDFEVGGIYYLIDGTNATVTFRGTSYGQYSNEYSGNVVIPESVTYNGATYSVTSIGNQAFRSCSGLTSVTIPNSVTSIGTYAFDYCRGLISVTIGNSVTSIGIAAFQGCSGLETIVVDNGNGTYDSRGNCNAIIETASNTLIVGCKNTIIPNSVTSIGNIAFSICTGLTSITIPDSVTSIGYRAFYDCSGLISVTIGNSVTSIGEGAFLGCSGLTSVTIPNSVTSIGDYTFQGCSGLISVTIGNSVTSIGGVAFGGCSGLTSVTIPNSVTSIGVWAFRSCSGLTSVTIPNSVTSIGGNAFQDCSGLTSVTLTGHGAWNYYSNKMSGLRDIIGQLKNVSIGSGITSLGNFGFAPDVVNCYAEVPPTCSPNTFANYDGALHVPTTATVAYMSAEYWQNFNNLNNNLIEKITLNASNATLVQHEELQLTATVTSMVQNDEVLWCSTNAAVATVDDNGKVTAIDQGECDIYATLSTNPAVYASCHITASYPEITALSLNKDSIEFGDAGEAFTLIATTTPANSGPSPTWTSSDETVATVDANGLVTATGQGECDITATVLNQSATCHVTVNSTIVITLDQHEMELDLNHMAVLTPTCSPAETDLTATSSDPSVVFARIVTQDGTAKVQLVGMKQGEATITVASVDGKAIPDSCVVTVVRRVGDLNADGYINVMDITTLIELIMGNVDAPDDAEMPYCDVKADGEINVMDITALIDIIMNS